MDIYDSVSSWLRIILLFTSFWKNEYMSSLVVQEKIGEAAMCSIDIWISMCFLSLPLGKLKRSKAAPSTKRFGGTDIVWTLLIIPQHCMLLWLYCRTVQLCAMSYFIVLAANEIGSVSAFKIQRITFVSTASQTNMKPNLKIQILISAVLNTHWVLLSESEIEQWICFDDSSKRQLWKSITEGAGGTI